MVNLEEISRNYFSHAVSLKPDILIEICPIRRSNIGLYELNIVFYWYFNKYKLKSMLQKTIKNIEHVVSIINDKTII